LKFAIEIVALFVEELEDTCVDLESAEFVLEKKHYKVRFLELEKFPGKPI
jgi:hypothetical protein